MTMERRAFIALLGGVATWPLASRAQQGALPVIGFVTGASAEASVGNLAAFRKGLGQAGYIEGQNVVVEYHWLEGRYESLPALMADLVHRRVAVIATPVSGVAAAAAKAATATIPIVFGVGDPVGQGLVASLNRPGGNATGVNIFGVEIVAKRLALLHELVPKASRIAVLVNPGSRRNAEVTVQNAEEAARVIGLRIEIINAGTSREIDAAFDGFAQARPDALFVEADAFFAGRRVQLATLAARERIPAAYADREIVEVGGLMNYNVDIADSFRQVGAYCGAILRGAKPADLPVVQATKFEFILNLQTARLLRIDVPPTLIAIADEVIE
jgi:putative ABC transport system substrate-binding protein